MEISGSSSRQPDHSSGKRPRAFLRRFLRDGKGSVAIEFAALAIPFSLLVFAVLESCISFAAQQMMMNATDTVAREFRTGQLRPADVEKDKQLVWNKICEKIQILVSSDCPGLVIDLKSHATFAEAAAVRIKFTFDHDIDTTGFSVEPGTSGTKNQLRVFYRWPVMTDFLRKSMSNLKDGKTLHYASVTWQNEPFDD